MHGGCVKGMPIRRDDQPGTGCRQKCLHRQMVEEYRDAKILSDEARKLQREAETGGFPAEVEQWNQQHPAWTFKDFLISRKGGRVVDMNIKDRPTDSTENWDFFVESIWPYRPNSDFENMAIPVRNAILDDLRRREENLERRAEERRNGTWAIPAHVRKDLL